jgi:hypothetical protein
MCVRPSVCLTAWNRAASIGRIFMKFNIWIFFGNPLRKFKFYYNLTRIPGTSNEDQYTFFIISRSILLRMRNVSDKICRGNQNTLFCSTNFCFRKSCRLLDNVVILYILCWRDLCEVILFWSEVKWSVLRWILGIKVPCTLGWPYTEGT